MGGSSSKQVAAPTPMFSAPQKSVLEKRAYIGLEEAEQREKELADQIEQTRLQAEAQIAALNAQLSGVSGTYQRYKYLLYFVGAFIFVMGTILLYDFFALKNGMQTVIMGPAAKESFKEHQTPCDQAADDTVVKQPLLSQLINKVSRSLDSGDLIPSPHDATKDLKVLAESAPISDQSQGLYGYQWWMFVREWNTGYGREKHILSRSDPTNPTVMNPNIYLHPTDNTMNIAIPIFATSDKVGTTTPAPADASTNLNNDVFICGVPNIPLQKWFSVSVTVFTRNLDVYIDGKLVKSCFIPGVPKPAFGNIAVTQNGGFAGYMCSLKHYSKMLTPTDAASFFNAGTSCKSSADTTGITSTSGKSPYTVSFGVYNPEGKKVQNYSFG